MYQEEKTFTLRFSLEASFPEEYEGDEDRLAWVSEWETHMKPQVLKQIFESLRQYPTWTSHVRNRGVSPTDEIEIVVARDYSKPVPFTLSS